MILRCIEKSISKSKVVDSARLLSCAKEKEELLFGRGEGKEVGRACCTAKGAGGGDTRLSQRNPFAERWMSKDEEMRRAISQNEE